MRVLIQTAALTGAAAMALPLLAGTWTDIFEDPGLDNWEIYDFDIYPHSNVARFWIDGADHLGIFDPGVRYILTATNVAG